MHFFANSSSSTNGVRSKLMIVLCCTLLWASTVSGHGHMIQPQIRIPPGDQNNGLTITRGPTHVQPCAGNPPGPVLTTLTAGQSFPIQWEIGAAHQGNCTFELSENGDNGPYQTLKEFQCANAVGTFNDVVPLPANTACDHCTFRFRWNALLTGELYLDCADVKIVGGSGGSGGNGGSGNSNSGSSAATTSTHTTVTGTTPAAATNTPNGGTDNTRTGKTTATGTTTTPAAATNTPNGGTDNTSTGKTTATNTAVTTTPTNAGTAAPTTVASGIPTGKHGRKHGKKGKKHGKGIKHGNKGGQCPFGNGDNHGHGHGSGNGATVTDTATTTSGAAAASDTTTATTTSAAYY